MFDAVIIEDEFHNSKNLELLLKEYCPAVQVVASADNAEDGIKMIKKAKPQLIFLDIQMPGKDGFQMLRELNTNDFEIIFVTAFSEYGIKAIKFSAIDYLLKPVNIDELKKAVSKAAEKIKQKSENQNLKNLLHYLQQISNKNEHRIAISSLKEIRLVPVSEIVRCESENTYTSFFLNNMETIVSTQPISVYEELLADYGFIRCHQSHLVNKKYVKSFLKTDGFSLLMDDNSIVPVSRLKKDNVRNELLKRQ